MVNDSHQLRAALTAANQKLQALAAEHERWAAQLAAAEAAKKGVETELSDLQSQDLDRQQLITGLQRQVRQGPVSQSSNDCCPWQC